MNKLSGLIFLILIQFLLSSDLFSQYDLPKTISEKNSYYKQLEEIRLQNILVKTSWNYPVVNGTVTSNGYKDMITEYDNEGKISEIKHLNRNGDIQSIVIYKYNKQKLPVSTTEYLPLGQIIKRTVSNYDENGCISGIVVYNEYEYIISKTGYEKMNYGNCVIETVYFSPDSIIESNKYCYSSFEEGLLASFSKFNNGNVPEYERFVIWDNNKIKEELYCHPDGEPVFRLSYVYDHLNRNTEIIKELPGEIKNTLNQYRYDSDGNLTGYIKYSDNGNVLEYYKYSYNK